MSRTGTNEACHILLCFGVRFMARTMLISIVSRKSLRLSGEGRVKHTNGQLVTHISAVRATSFASGVN